LMAEAQAFNGLGRFLFQAGILALHGAGKADIVLRQPRLFRGQGPGLAHMAGAEQGGFLIHYIDQGGQCRLDHLAELFGRQAVKGGKACGCGHLRAPGKVFWLLAASCKASRSGMSCSAIPRPPFWAMVAASCSACMERQVSSLNPPPITLSSVLMLEKSCLVSVWRNTPSNSSA